MIFERITSNPDVMGGRPCIKGTRITAGTLTGLAASGKSWDEILQLYPALQREDIAAALEYAAWRSEEQEVRLSGA
jgi:uncharacterized protein (DUF433 family)